MDTQEKRNLVYPVGGGVFIHVVHDPEDTRDYYLAVEPSLAPELEGITSDVDSQLMEYIDELRQTGDEEARLEVILDAVDQICSRSKGRKKTVKTVKESDDKYDDVRYMMILSLIHI